MLGLNELVAGIHFPPLPIPPTVLCTSFAYVHTVRAARLPKRGLQIIIRDFWLCLELGCLATRPVTGSRGLRDRTRAHFYAAGIPQKSVTWARRR